MTKLTRSKQTAQRIEAAADAKYKRLVDAAMLVADRTDLRADVTPHPADVADFNSAMQKLRDALQEVRGG